jgi:hypothetical protein
MSEKFVVRVVVGGVGYEGPDMWFVKVICNQEQLDEGLHYEAAKNWVGENILNADDINWACDDKDPAKAILDCFNWDTARIVKI